MGRIIQIDNGKTTVYVNGEDVSSLSATTDTYYIGVDTSNGIYEKLNPNGDLINLENGSIVDTDYASIISSIGSNSLIPGVYYNIADFETIYDQPDYFLSLNDKPIVTTKTATAEPLIVYAISTSGVSTQAFQPNYPKNKISYDITFSSTELMGVPAKGRITEMIDEYNNRTDYDHMSVVFKRYQTYDKNVQLTGTITDYDCITGTMSGSGTLFTSLSPGDIILLDTYNSLGYEVGVKVAAISDDTNLTTYVDPFYSGTIFSLENYDFYSSTPSGYISYKEVYVAQSNESDYNEYTTFQSNSGDNYIGDFALLQLTFGFSRGPFLLSNNIFGSYSFSNKSSSYFFNNTFDYASENEIGSGFFNNYFSNFYYNKIAGNCSNNYVTGGFDQNTIGYQFTNNIITSNFGKNIIGGSFQNNIINGMGTFWYNTFIYPTIGVNFSAATHVYGNYTCEIFKGNDLNLYLSYFDGTSMVYTGITS